MVGLLMGLCLGLAMMAVSEIPVYASPDIKIFVNDQMLNTQKSGLGLPATIRDGRIYVPIRLVSEALAAEVDWKNETVIIDLQNGKKLQLQIGSDTASINGQTVSIDAPPFMWYSRTMVPIRFIAENYDAKVQWDGTINAVKIAKPGFTVAAEYTAPYVPLPDFVIPDSQPELKRLKELLPQTILRSGRGDLEPFFFVQYSSDEPRYIVFCSEYNFEAPENKIMLRAFFSDDDAKKVYDKLWILYKNPNVPEIPEFTIDGKKCRAIFFDTNLVLNIQPDDNGVMGSGGIIQQKSDTKRLDDAVQ